MQLILWAVVIALLAALLDWFIGGIKEPWRKVIFAGVVVMFVVGLILLIFPGLFGALRL